MVAWQNHVEKIPGSINPIFPNPSLSIIKTTTTILNIKLTDGELFILLKFIPGSKSNVADCGFADELLEMDPLINRDTVVTR